MHNKSEVVHGHVMSQVIRDDGLFPNNHNLPLLVYKGALLLRPDDEPESILERFSKNGWTNGWKDGIYDYHHYHSTAHEVLGVFCGTADVQLGGPDGICVELSRGDVIVIPAGVAHKNLDSSADFLCAGAYADGSDYDMNYGKEEERESARKNILSVPRPQTDPLYGAEGPLLQHWAAK